MLILEMISCLPWISYVWWLDSNYTLLFAPIAIMCPLVFRFSYIQCDSCLVAVVQLVHTPVTNQVQPFLIGFDKKNIHAQPVFFVKGTKGRGQTEKQPPCPTMITYIFFNASHLHLHYRYALETTSESSLSDPATIYLCGHLNLYLVVSICNKNIFKKCKKTLTYMLMLMFTNTAQFETLFLAAVLLFMVFMHSCEITKYTLYSFQRN